MIIDSVALLLMLFRSQDGQHAYCTYVDDHTRLILLQMVQKWEVCMYVCACVCVYACMCVCVCVCVCMCMHVCMYACILTLGDISMMKEWMWCLRALFSWLRSTPIIPVTTNPAHTHHNIWTLHTHTHTYVCTHYFLHMHRHTSSTRNWKPHIEAGGNDCTVQFQQKYSCTQSLW